MKPVLLINYKAYETAYGEVALSITRGLAELQREFSEIEIIASVPATMISRLAGLGVRVYAQHVDPNPPGAFTGSVTAEMIKEAGASGSLINHSERRIGFDEVAEAVKRLSSLGLESVVCVDRSSLVGPASLLGPTYVLVEPPELIGTGISVSRARPEVVTDSVREAALHGGRLLVGAGISKGEDAYRSIELGAAGIGLASAVMKAKDPLAVARELAQGLIDGQKRAQKT